MTDRELNEEPTRENKELRAECWALQQQIDEIEVENKDLNAEIKKLMEWNEWNKKEM